MNSDREPYIVITDHRFSSTPGAGGLMTQSIIMKGRTPPDFMYDSNYSSPATLVYIEEEGSNTPFHSRFGTVKELPWDVHRLKRDNQIKVVEISTWGIDMPHIIFEDPPDTTPITVTKFDELPWDGILKLRRLKQNVAINSVQDAPGYDVKKIAATEYFLSTCDVLTKVQERLMEAPNSGVTFESGQWNQAEALRYLNDRVNHFIERTGLIRKTASIPVTDGNRDYELPTDLMELNRATFHLTDTVKPLYRIDKYQLDQGRPGWELETGTPEAIIEEPLEYLDLILFPTPDQNGILELVYTPSFTLTNTPCDHLPIPAPFEPFITWGVVADMLKREGELHDPERAEYADQRYEEGIQLALLMRGNG